MAYHATTLMEVLLLYKRELPMTLIKGYLQDILHGLCYLHSREIVHGDLKVANVLISQQGKAVVTDLSEGCFGTPNFMSPEQIKMELVTIQSDIFSFGSLAIELITGYEPYHLLMPQTAMYKIVESDMEIPKCDAWMTDLLTSCFHKDPTCRPSAKSLLNHSYFQSIHIKRSMSFNDKPVRSDSLLSKAIKPLIEIQPITIKHRYYKLFIRSTCQWCLQKSFLQYCKYCHTTLCLNCSNHLPYGCVLSFMAYLRIGYPEKYYHSYVLKYNRQLQREILSLLPPLSSKCTIL